VTLRTLEGLNKVCKVNVDVVFKGHTKGLEKNDFFSAFIWADFQEKVSRKMGNFTGRLLLPTKVAHNEVLAMSKKVT